MMTKIPSAGVRYKDLLEYCALAWWSCLPVKRKPVRSWNPGPGIPDDRKSDAMLKISALRRSVVESLLTSRRFNMETGQDTVSASVF